MRKNTLVIFIGLLVFWGSSAPSVALPMKEIKNIELQLERLCLKKRACTLSSSASKKLDYNGRQKMVSSMSTLCESVKKEYSAIKRFTQSEQINAAFACLNSLQAASCDTVLDSNKATIGCNAYHQIAKPYQSLLAQ